MIPIVQGYFDPATATISYIVYEKAGSSCAIIDSVIDYDPLSNQIETRSVDQIIDFVQANQLRVEWILETHLHADHLTAAAYLKSRLGGQTAIGSGITAVQSTVKKTFNWDGEFKSDGSQFDRLFDDGAYFQIGNLSVTVLHVPGHTPSCAAYCIGDAVFVGDTLFMPDLGTARCDFPGGDAYLLYQSVRKILSLPSQTRLFMCHDYPPKQRTPQWATTVAQQRAHNIHIHDGVTQAEFVAMRTARDKTLAIPALMQPAIQVNARAGTLPPTIEQ